jgi:predicted NAD-dependent protein-ADP-ribosyltransferase YbiA (DUF1768 family)
MSSCNVAVIFRAVMLQRCAVDSSRSKMIRASWRPWPPHSVGRSQERDGRSGWELLVIVVAVVVAFVAYFCRREWISVVSSVASCRCLVN